MKNIISNILGILIVGFSVYGLLFLDLVTIKFTLIIIIGLGCFYFENATIKRLLEKYINSKIK